MRLLITISILLTTVCASAQTIKIGLFNSKNIQAYSVSVQKGKYLLECDGEKYGEYRRNNIFFINPKSSQIEIRDSKSLIGSFNQVSLKPISRDCILTLKGVNPSTKAHEYQDVLQFSITDNTIKAINKVNMEKYIAGVVEAEGGGGATPEFYKAQAVLIRTYTIKNLYKHGEERFNLCDEVHCQAFHGRSIQNDEIYKATTATAGQVLIDSDSILLMSPFHANCGGQTISPGMYWQKDLAYLASVYDPFCTTSRSAIWTKQISINEWGDFLRSKNVSAPYDQYQLTAPVRKKYFIDGKVTYRDIREFFHLKSAYFSIVQKGNSIVLNGKGYGHGIGMCQQGAIEMGRVGYTYLDIIHFYFKDVSITDYREMELHRY